MTWWAFLAGLWLGGMLGFLAASLLSMNEYDDGGY